jgi:hypothetical protein
MKTMRIYLCHVISCYCRELQKLHCRELCRKKVDKHADMKAGIDVKHSNDAAKKSNKEMAKQWRVGDKRILILPIHVRNV